MRNLPKTTAARLAACAAVGLSYWSGHPLAGHVWAVDDTQQAHAVQVDYKRGQARRVYEHQKAWARGRYGDWANWDGDDGADALVAA